MPLDEPEPQLPELRNITDARTLRALTHPVRIALLEALSLGGAMTATEVGEQISESPTTCSFHLRQLAKYGFVEEAEAGTDQRERRWRVPEGRPRIRVPAEANPVVSQQLARLVVEREAQAVLSYLDGDAEGGRIANAVALMSSEEAAQVWQKIQDLLRPYAAQAADPAPGQQHYRWFLAATPADLDPEGRR
jgi:DNA-binding transcriptional ArsR family regulator